MKYIILGTSLLALSACNATVKSDEMKVKGKDYSVEIGDDNGDFCPPGQAKKGNC